MPLPLPLRSSLRISLIGCYRRTWLSALSPPVLRSLFTQRKLEVGRLSSLFFGWKVVGAALVVAVFSWGIAFYGPSVFLHELHVTRGWPVSLISAAVTTHFLLSAGLVIYLSDVHERFGVAATTQAGAVLLALGALGWAFAAEPWQLFLAAIVLAAGWTATNVAAINAMVAPWFAERRGYALSLALNGASLGGVIFTPLWVALIAAFGLPTAASIVAAATVAALWPIAGRYFRPLPADMGLAPDGRVVRHDDRPSPPRPPSSRRAIMRQPRFITLSGAFTLGMLAQVGLIAHLVAMLAPRLGDGGAALAMSLATVCAVAGRLALGAIIGRFDRRVASAGNLLLQCCGSLLLLTSDGPVGALAGCILFGLGLGNLVSLPPLIAQVEFDPADLGRAVALVASVNQAAASFAPALFGLLRDLAGGYALPLALAAALQAAAALLLLPRRRAG